MTVLLKAVKREKRVKQGKGEIQAKKFLTYCNKECQWVIVDFRLKNLTYTIIYNHIYEGTTQNFQELSKNKTKN